MRFQLLICPDYVLRWDGGSVSFDDREGAIIARLARGRRATFLELVSSIYYQRGPGDIDDPIGLGFLPSVTAAIDRVRLKLRGTPFQIRLSGSQYSFGARLDRVADRILAEGLSEKDKN